jgi:hypothetical protein
MIIQEKLEIQNYIIGKKKKTALSRLEIKHKGKDMKR